MVFLQNTAEGGTDNTTVSTANSGGSSGDAWDSIIAGGSGAITFDNEHVHRGSMAYKVVGDSASSVLLEWGTSLGTVGEVWGRAYVYFTATPSANHSLIWLRNGTDQVARIRVNTSGLLEVLNNANSVVDTSSAALATGQWVRIEFHCIALAANGTIEADFYNTPDSLTPTDSVSSTTAALFTNLTRVNFGRIANASPNTVWLDDLALSTTAEIGPSTQTVTPSGIATAEAVGSHTLTLGPALVSPSGIASAEAVGTPALTGGAQLSPTGIASAEAVGTPAVLASTPITVTGISSSTLAGEPTLTREERRYYLTPPTISEGPAAWDRLFVRYSLNRGITIVQRNDGTFYETRYPAQTELEEAAQYWLGGYRHELEQADFDALIAAGYTAYLESEAL